MADVERNFADLSLEDEEVVVVQLASERLDLGASFENCFVGSFLTSGVVNFQSMRATLENVDTDRIKASRPWNFNSHLLVMCKLRDGDDPKTVPLFNEEFWVLVQDLPHGFMSELVKLLKRKKKIVLPNGTQTYVSFACKKLKLFCFLCGILGHGKSFCPVRILQEKQDLIIGWDISLHAPTRQAVAPKSVWLREEDMFGMANFGATNSANEKINEDTGTFSTTMVLDGTGMILPHSNFLFTLTSSAFTIQTMWISHLSGCPTAVGMCKCRGQTAKPHAHVPGRVKNPEHSVLKFQDVGDTRPEYTSMC
ncbi:hypothetical protein CXB51_034093 [Gossypium anomalum]|uniref:Zinc knuckle CX2CX4HX4C domain-containing protein n=1 Tax=Gossypium anomalum TaxID=47600 RepID=A0A8J5YPH8_9ROSI|nr:hypothetical protein CXB51_034093 [Gossypium anomalum]